MAKKRLIFIFLITIILININFIFAYTESGGVFYCNTTCADCNSALSNNTYNTVYLNSSLIKSGGTCITIPSDNKIFDCQRNTITGDDTDYAYGVYIEDVSNNIIRNCNVSKFWVGIETTTWSGVAENNTIKNNTANNNTYVGIDVYLANNNFILDNIADYNGWDTKDYYPTGISLFQASGNSIINNTARHNRYKDLSVVATINSECDNIIENMNVSGGREYLYFNSSTTLSDQTIGGLILCNADGSNITNVTIKGSTQIKNNGISMSLTNNCILDGINSSYNAEWVLDTETDNNIITNSFVEYNDYVGITFSLCASGNNITNNQINNNTKDGIVITSQCSSGNIFDNNSVSFNGEEGFDFYKGSSQTIINNQINNNTNNGIKLATQCSSNILENNTISYSGINGLLISGAGNNNRIINTLIANSTQNDTKLTTSSTNNTFINVTYNLAKEYVDTSSKLYMWFYLNVFSIDQIGSVVSSANISIFNESNILMESQLTDSLGYTSNFELLSYFNNGTNRYYSSNYTINGTKSGYNENITNINLTSSTIYSLLLFNNNLPTIATEVDTTTTNGGGYSIANLKEEELNKGYQKIMYKNWKLKFEIENETHELKLDEIQNNSVTITISSDPITFNLLINETKKIDLDDDGFYDIFVILKNVTGNSYNQRAEVYLKSINEVLENQLDLISGDEGSHQNNILENIPTNKFIYGLIIFMVCFLAFRFGKRK